MEKAAFFIRHRKEGTGINAKLNKQLTDDKMRTKKGLLSLIDIIVNSQNVEFLSGDRGIKLIRKKIETLYIL